MDDFVNTWLFNSSVGKIVAIVIGVAVIWTIMKVLKRRIAGPMQKYRQPIQNKES